MDRHPTAHGRRSCRTRADQEGTQVGVSKRAPFPPGLLPCLADDFGDICTTHADRLPCKTAEHCILRRRFPQVLIPQCHSVTLPFLNKIELTMMC
jgi:hypothetical protein